MIHRSPWRPSLSKSLGLAKASSKCHGTTCDPFIALLGPRTCLTLWYSRTAGGSEHVIRIYKFQITTVFRGRCQEFVILNCVQRGHHRPHQFRNSAAHVPRDRTRREMVWGCKGGDSRVLGEQNTRITSAHRRASVQGESQGDLAATLLDLSADGRRPLQSVRSRT